MELPNRDDFYKDTGDPRGWSSSEMDDFENKYQEALKKYREYHRINKN